MNEQETDVVIRELISSVGRRCVNELKYTSLSSEEVNKRIDLFHQLHGYSPTFEEVKKFNDENDGINCALFSEAACDLLRSKGITADRVNLLNPYTAKAAADNHAVVRVAERYWLEPQTGEIFLADDWNSLAAHYALLLDTDSKNIVGYCSRSEQSYYGSDWDTL